MGLLLLIDGHAYAYRAFHAIRGLTSPGGQPTNAIFGFIKMLEKMRGRLQPSHLAVVWDGGLAAERTAILPEYKAQRPSMPDDLRTQLDGMVAYLQAAGVVSLCAEGVEADDWIASLSAHAGGEMSVVIASSDKDFLQLVTPRIGLVNPNDKVERVWTRAEVRAKCGVEPEQVVDLLSLMGDSVDNIPGVAGIGAKTAAELLNQFGSVEELYRRLEEVKPERRREGLKTAQAIVRRNQRVIKLKCDVGRRVELAEMELGTVAPTRLHELYRDWGFRSMAAELQAPAKSAQVELF